MKLVEFLICLLDAQAQTLQRLAALFGEDAFIEILESQEAPSLPPSLHSLNPAWFEASGPTGYSSSYAELEGAVRDFRLSEVLEFHLWAYPHYRAFIESSIDLTSKIIGPGTDTGVVLVDEAVAQAQDWVRKLPIHPSMSRQAELAAHVPWLKFRAQILKRIGKRPLGPVY